jgi:RimJ/RimL family protein N-acetyltransferase
LAGRCSNREYAVGWYNYFSMITFHIPNDEDLHFINSWHQEASVVTFYNSGSEIDTSNSADKYLPNQYGQVLIIESDLLPVGLLSVGFYSTTSVSIVYFIGEKEQRHKGLGAEILKAFVDYAGTQRWKTINASVSEVNYPSWKALLNAGFKFSGKKKNQNHYDKLPNQEFDDVILFFAQQYAKDEVDLHALIADQLIAGKADLLNCYEQILAN